jgi:prefoldin subunit 5
MKATKRNTVPVQSEVECELDLDRALSMLRRKLTKPLYSEIEALRKELEAKDKLIKELQFQERSFADRLRVLHEWGERYQIAYGKLLVEMSKLSGEVV